MALQYSTGFKNSVLATASVKGTFDGGFIHVYAGTVPADADAALGGATELVKYSVGGDGVTGLTLDGAGVAAGVIDKTAAESWEGVCGSVGTQVATFWRYSESGDGGGASTTIKRIQGTIGGAGADLFVSSTSFTNGVTYTLDFFSLTIPNL